MTTPAAIPICESCVHLAPCANAELPGMGACCPAFPQGIPEVVLVEGYDHRKPLDGDGGVQWELSAEAGATERLAAYEASLA